MRINVKQPILDYEGKPLKVNKMDESGSVVFDENRHPVMISETARNYMAAALNNSIREEVFTAEQKAQAYQLTRKLYARNEVDLTPNERYLIKERIEKHTYPPLICGRIIDILFPEEVVKDKPAEIPEEDIALAKAKK